MQNYTDVDGDSGVAAYEIGADFILVQFKDGGIYEYTSASVGTSNLTHMMRLAQQGDGLNSFINRNVRKNYSRKVA